MRFSEVLRVAFRALARNKMRTLLTMLGIIIGVGAVICTVAIGEGASQQVQEQIQSLGENLITVNAGSVNLGGVHLGSAATKSLVVADATAIQEQISTVSRVSPGVGAGATLVADGGLQGVCRGEERRPHAPGRYLCVQGDVAFRRGNAAWRACLDGTRFLVVRRRAEPARAGSLPPPAPRAGPVEPASAGRGAVSSGHPRELQDMTNRLEC